MDDKANSCVVFAVGQSMSAERVSNNSSQLLSTKTPTTHARRNGDRIRKLRESARGVWGAAWQQQ